MRGHALVTSAVPCEPHVTPTEIDDHVVLDTARPETQVRTSSEARQMRKLAAALRQPPQPGAVDVNVGSDENLLQQLTRIRKLPRAAAQRIVALRPFSSRTDLITRVNASMEKQNRLGPSYSSYSFVLTVCCCAMAHLICHRFTLFAPDPSDVRR